MLSSAMADEMIKIISDNKMFFMLVLLPILALINLQVPLDK